MPWFQIVVLLIFASIGLIFFLRYILTRHFANVQGRLDELTQDYATKQAELDKRFRQAKQEYQDIIIKVKKDAEELRNKSAKEANDEKERLISEAHQKSEEMVSQAERTCEFLRREIEQKIEEGSVNKACELLEGSIPEKFRKELHELWMKDVNKSEFQIDRINLPKDIKEARIVSAFPLSKQSREDLQEKLKKSTKTPL